MSRSYTRSARDTNTLERRIWRGCIGKVKHTSKRHAVAAIRLFLKRIGEAANGTLVAYKCKSCGAWHSGRDSRMKSSRAH